MTEKVEENQNGGKRAGSGRKKGEPNKRTAEALVAAEALGVTPLVYLLGVMHNHSDEKMRMSAATAAAPYVHAKLASIDMKATVTVKSHEEWVAELGK